MRKENIPASFSPGHSQVQSQVPRSIATRLLCTTVHDLEKRWPKAAWLPVEAGEYL